MEQQEFYYGKAGNLSVTEMDRIVASGVNCFQHLQRV